LLQANMAHMEVAVAGVANGYSSLLPVAAFDPAKDGRPRNRQSSRRSTAGHGYGCRTKRVVAGHGNRGRLCAEARWLEAYGDRNCIAGPDGYWKRQHFRNLKGWSFRDLERELRSNLVYRRFTRFDAEVTPDFSTFSRTFALLSPQITEQIHQRVVGLAREQGVAQGRKLRTDTTVVESHVHYPTDSTLLGDGIRVLSRSLVRIAAECKDGALEVVHHGRAVKHRLLEIGRAAKSLTEANQQRMRDSYQKLVELTRSVVRQASEVVQRWGKGRLKVVGKLHRVEAQIGQLRHFLPLVEKVITQTKERVWGGNCHVEGKVLSLFEPHTEVIRKGKAHKPNEFGRLVRVDEVENGIVSGYQVLSGNPEDSTAWMPALQQHQAR